jgi:hypothetical protein
VGERERKGEKEREREKQREGEKERGRERDINQEREIHLNGRKYTVFIVCTRSICIFFSFIHSFIHPSKSRNIKTVERMLY